MENFVREICLREDIRKMKTEMEYNIKETATRVRV
jgi:hypothetical protein